MNNGGGFVERRSFEKVEIIGLYHRFGHKGASSRGEGLAKTWG